MNYLLKYLIPTLLGDYIEGIDYNNVKTSYFSGQISLQNISLKKDILTKKGIPLDIKYSVIGKLELRVPWLKVRKEPIVVTVNDLYLIITLSDPQKLDPIRQRLFFMNEISRACYEKTKSIDTQDENKGNFSNMRINILDNLQLSLKNIHIRFEDPDRSTILGFVLDEFSVFTTNENWEREFLDRTIETNKLKNLWKKATISNLVSYCTIEQDKSKFLFNSAFTDEYRKNYLKVQMEATLKQNPTKNKESEESSHLIFKMSAELKMIKKNRNLDSIEDPKLHIELHIKEQGMTLHHTQIENLLISTERATNLGKFIEHHPPDLTAEEKIIKQKEFDNLLKKYIESRKGEDADWISFYDEDKSEMGNNFRKQLVIVSDEMIIVSINEAIFDAEKKSLVLSKKKSSGLRGFFTKKATGITEEESMVADEFMEQLIQKNEEELKKMNEGFLFRICLRIENGTLFLINEEQKKNSAGVSFEMDNFECRIESWKKAERENFQLITKLDQVLVFLKSKGVGSNYYKQFNIVKRLNDNDQNRKQVFELVVSREADKLTERLTVKGEVQELVVNYLTPFFNQIVKFTKFDSRLHKLEQIAKQEIGTLKTGAGKNLKGLIDKVKKLELSIDFMVASPKFVIPLQQNGDFGTDIWLMNVGNIHITTPQDTKYDEMTYRIIGLSITGLSLQYFTKWQSWLDKKLEAEHHNVLEDTDANLIICYMHSSLKRTSKSAAVVVDCVLDLIALNTSKMLLIKLLQLPYCLNFTKERGYQELLETQKAQIMRTHPALFKLFSGEERDVPCIGLFFEYYLYLYNNPTDLSPMKIVRLVNQKISLTQDSEYYTVKMTDPSEDQTYISFSDKLVYEKFTSLMYERISLGKEILGEYKSNLKLPILVESAKNDETIQPIPKGTDASQDRTLMEFQFKISRLKLGLKGNQSTFSVAIGKMELINTNRCLQRDLSFNIDSFQVCAIKNGTSHNLISSERFQDSKFPNKEALNIQLFSWNSSNYTREHPHFLSNGCKSNVNLIFNSLYVFWKPLLISEMLFTIVDSFAEKRAEDVKFNRVQNKAKDDVEMIKRKQSKDLVHALQSGKTLEYNANNIKIMGLFLSIFTPKTEIEMASFSLNNLEMTVSTSIQKLHLKGRLENLQITDLTNYPLTISDNSSPVRLNVLFGIDKSAKSLLEFDIVRYPEYYPGIIDRKRMLMKFDLQSVVITYMQQPVLRIIDYIMNYFMNINVTKLLASDDRTLQEIRDNITNATFNDVKITVEKIKVIARAHPSLPYWFEVDIGMLDAFNGVTTHRKRLKDNINSIAFTYNEFYKMYFKRVTLNRVFGKEETVSFTNQFDFYLDYERCLFGREYSLLVNDELKTNNPFPIDDSYKLTGNTKNLEIKLKRDEYVEIIDTTFHNVLNDDFKDYLYCFRPHLLKEELPIIRWAAKDERAVPITLDFLFGTVIITIWDETRDFPLARLQANEKKMLFNRSQERVISYVFKFSEMQIFKYNVLSKHEVSEASILSVTAFSEKRSTPMISNRKFLIKDDCVLEQIILPEDEKEHLMKEAEEEDKNNQLENLDEKYRENLSVKVVMHKGQKKINVDIQDLKVMAYVQELLRILEFCKYVPEALLEEDHDAKIKMGEVIEHREPTSLVFTVMANDSYFCIPSGTESVIVFKCNAAFSYSNRDIQQIIINSMIDSGLTELYTYKLTLQHTQMMVASEKDFVSNMPLSKFPKRILIHPYNLSFSLKTSVCKDQASNKMALFRKDNAFIDRLAIRIASRDLILLLESNFWLKDSLNAYKKLERFSSVEPEYKIKLSQRRRQRDDYFARWKIEQVGLDIYVIAHGMQIRLINETQKYSLPLMDITIFGDEAEPSLALTSKKGESNINCNLHVSSHYFNSNNSCWEPFIEKFEISLEVASAMIPSQSHMIKMVLAKPLNINISNELIDSALSTIFEWKQKYEASKPTKLDVSRLRKQKTGTIYLIEANDDNLNRTEHVSPYSVQNFVGYPITILPSEKSMKLELIEDEIKDIRFEKSVEELFSTQSEQNPFSHQKISLLINYPDVTISRSDAVALDEIAVKDVFFPNVKETKPQIFCDIQDKGKKRSIIFTSSVQITNEFNITFEIEFFRKDGLKKITKILPPGKTTSIPFDLVNEWISFAASKLEKKSVCVYEVSSILKQKQVEIALPTIFCKLMVTSFPKYSCIQIAPMLRIKNCLPIKINFEVTNKEVGETRKQVGALLCQEVAQINALSLQDAIYLRLELAECSASTKVQLSNGKAKFPVKKILLKGLMGSVELRLYQPQTNSDEIIIYAKSCIVNETGIPLLYLLKDCKPFPGSNEQNSKGTLVFDKIKEIRMQPMMTGSDFTEEIPIEGLGDRNVDIKMGKSPSSCFNLGLNISSRLCERNHNLMTKVVSVAPRYLILNETPYTIVVIQDKAETLENIIEPNERLILHFQQPLLRKYLRFKVSSGKDEYKWTWSGAIDCTGPGEYHVLTLDEKCQKVKYFKVSITLESPSFFIQIFEQSLDKTGLRIVNDLDCLDLMVAQQGKSDRYITVPRKKWVAFAWFEPCDCKDVIILRLIDGSGGKVVAYNNYTFDKIGEKTLLISKYQHKDKILDIFMEINLHGSSKVMRVYTQKSKVSLLPLNFVASLMIHTIGCSVIYSRGRERVEMVYLALHPVIMAFKSDKKKLEAQVKIKVIEIDNNTVFKTIYPCTLYPMSFAKEKNDIYTLDVLTIFYLPNEENQLLHFEKINILLNDLAIRIEGKLLEIIFRFGKNILDQLQRMTNKFNGYTETLFFSPEEKKALLADNGWKSIYKWQLYNPGASAGSLVYIKELAVYPISLFLSYQHTTLKETGDKLLETFISTSFVSSIASFEDAPVSLGGIKLEGVWDKWSDISKKVFANYKSQATEVVLGVAFSSRIIGNPVKLFGGIAQGVQDLVEKPIEGFSEGPLAGGTGLLKGVESLATKTLGGTFGVVQNITGSLADGISRLAVDKKYELSRDRTKAKKNSNIFTGLAQGVVTFGKSTFSGVTGKPHGCQICLSCITHTLGVVTKPVEGAQKEGFLGFLKGAGKGIAGLVVKPVSGTLDAVSKVSEGVSNTIDSKKDKFKSVRFRPIRTLYGKSKLVKEYSVEDALGYEIICAYRSGKYSDGLIWMDSFAWEVTKETRNEGIISKFQKKEGCYMLVLGIPRVFLLNLTKKKILWKVLSGNIDTPAEIPGGVFLKLKTKDTKIKADSVPIELNDKDLKAEVLLGVTELIFHVKEKEDLLNMSLSKSWILKDSVSIY